MSAPVPRRFDWLLFIAQGCGVGNCPVAPGTLGTFLGFVWFFVLLALRNPYLVGILVVVSVALSIWAATHAERALNQSDPGSVIIDEIVAIPFCFLGWLFQHSELPSVAEALRHPLMLALVFCGFRFFDIVKPWPVGASQKLPRGYGITIDDLLAAGYVNLIWLTPLG